MARESCPVRILDLTRSSAPLSDSHSGENGLLTSGLVLPPIPGGVEVGIWRPTRGWQEKTTQLTSAGNQPKARFAYLRLLVWERSKSEATQQDCKTDHVLGNPAKSEREEGRVRQRKTRIGWLVLLARSRLALAVLGGIYPISLSNAETPPRVLPHVNCVNMAESIEPF